MTLKMILDVRLSSFFFFFLTINISVKVLNSNFPIHFTSQMISSTYPFPNLNVIKPKSNAPLPLSTIIQLYNLTTKSQLSHKFIHKHEQTYHDTSAQDNNNGSSRRRLLLHARFHGSRRHWHGHSLWPSIST